jgi:hypothetical protein
MCFVGKATYRNLSRYGGYHEKTYSRWSRREFDFSELNLMLIKEEVISEEKVIGVVDASFLPKSGKKTEGLGNFWNGSVGKAEKGLEISLLGVVGLKSRTFYTVDARQTKDTPGTSRVVGYEKQIKERCSDLLGLDVSHLVGDGFYSKASFIATVLSSKLHYVGKLRRNADLRWPYKGEYVGRGRPRKYTTRANLHDNSLEGWNACGTLEDGTLVFSANLYSPGFKREIRVVILRKYDDKNACRQAILFSTDLELSPLVIVEYYKARFQIEFVFRDAKQHTGLKDCQARTSKQIQHHVNASLTALNILKLEDRKEKGINEQTVISIESWKRRKANQLFMDRIFYSLGIDVNSEKICNLRKELENFGVIAA